MTVALGLDFVHPDTGLTDTKPASRRRIPKVFTPGLRIPRQLVDDARIGADALALAVILTSCADADGVAVMRVRTVAKIAGGTDQRGRWVAAARTELEEAGYLSAHRTRGGIGIYRWRLTLRAGGAVRWDTCPRSVIAAMTAGELSRDALRFALVLDRAMGAMGYTRDRLGYLAAEGRISERSASRAMAALEAAGVVLTRRDVTGYIRLRPGTILPGEPRTVSEADQSDAAATEAAEVLGAGESLKPDGELPATDRSSSSPDSGAPIGNDLAPESLAPASSSRVSADRHLGDSQASATTGRERPKLRDGLDRESGHAVLRPRRAADPLAGFKRADVRAVVVEVPDWIPRRKWRPGLGAVIARALDSGLGREAIVSALTSHADPDDCGGRVIPAAKQALRILELDVRHGLACAVCGEPTLASGCSAHAAATLPTAVLGVPEAASARRAPDGGSWAQWALRQGREALGTKA